MTFEEIKNIIENGLITFETSKNHSDGRINSIDDEKSIVEYIKGLFPSENIIEAPPRFWYDICLKFDDNLFPINIKSTEGATADNISSKEGLYYALTGRDPKKDKVTNFVPFNNQITKYYNPTCKEDYYLCIFLKEKRKFFFSSLKRIPVVVPNGNNLPFQCKWDQENLKYSERNLKEQGDYLMEAYISSYIKRARGLDILLDWREKQ